MPNSQQTRPETADEQFKMLFDRTAKLNDAVSALLAPTWGSEAGIIPTGHPLYVGDKPPAAQEEQGAPVDWQDVAKRRERELKTVGEARHRAETAVAELAQAIRLTREYVGEEMLPAVEGWSWYDALRRWTPDLLDAMTQSEAATEATDEGNPAAAAEAVRQMDADPHGLKAGMIVKPYTDHGLRRWVFRCWGTETCDGWLSLDHTSEQSAERARDRHVAEEHAEQPEPATITDPEWLRQQYEAALRASWDTGVNLHRDEAIRRDTAAVMGVRDGYVALLLQRLRLADQEQADYEEHVVGDLNETNIELAQRAGRAEQRADRLAGLARDILHATHNISSTDWARWREQLDQLTEEQP